MQSGLLGVRELQDEVEHTLLLVCFKHGLCERLLLQAIIGFLRIPFIACLQGVHHCELCNTTWEDDKSVTLTTHLLSAQHCMLEAAVAAGAKCLVAHAAFTLARELGEQPKVSLNRFRCPSGLGITDRFCTPADVKRARALHRVRDLDMPAKCLRDSTGCDRHMEWLTPGQLLIAEDLFAHYRKRGKKESRRILRAPELLENGRKAQETRLLKAPQGEEQVFQPDYQEPVERKMVDRTPGRDPVENLEAEDAEEDDYDWPDY